jgi:hypothetical protein
MTGFARAEGEAYSTAAAEMHTTYLTARCVWAGALPSV